ncbi:TonB-dependent receptor [Bacteroides muris (ex Afrizal et al. 2022)]|uniref:TonB-dependent receptor n=4 Tax=Bacteroides TaxID=816 RepID=A0A4S2ANJ2_9BACE|nr:TonB-dependent receptor [Bacteroides muris (ex Afrizal et al. 2022)]TGY02362.1 TonB-dependent receptor [Bacteroides muris (ex Afrizal et al. 2022)]
MKQVNLRICQTILTLMLGLFLSVGAYAQNITVKGHVKDALGGVIGASIVEKGNATNGTITDFDGNFSLNVPKGATLVISFIGYKTQEVAAAPSIIVTLVEDSEMLDEVVVVGYGRTKKDDLTGSVTAIKPDELSKGITNNAQDMLVGKVAGVDVITSGGTPGSGAQIRVRGGSSLNASNDPLIVIDGLTIDNNTATGMSNVLAMVNPSDIETFTVLKDASATAIYGSRASNGVIIITTKKGKSGSAPKVSYNGDMTISMIQKKYDVLDGDEFRALVNGMWGENAGTVGLGDANTDWQDQIFRTAISHNHNVSISGGLKNMPYRLSVGYNSSDGIVETSWMRRANVGLNLSPSFFDNHLNLKVNAKYMYEKDRYADAGGAIGAALSMDPTQPVYFAADNPRSPFFGGYFQYSQTPQNFNSEWLYTNNPNAPQNPLALLKMKDTEAAANDFTGNIEADYKIHGFEDLHLHASYGGQYTESKQDDIISKYSYSNNYYGWNGVTQYYKYSITANAYAQYMKEIGAHNFDVMVGAEESHYHRNGYNYGQGTDPYTGEAYNPSSRKEQEWATHYSLVSYFGRLNYTLLNRYMLTATFRADGSSRFHEDNRWGYFPSVAFAWKINEEAFMKDLTWWNEFKLRLGWGMTGQQDIGTDFGYVTHYTVSDSYAQYPFGDIYYGTMRPSAYNPDLKWETTTTYNAGIDLGFLNNRITANVDGYYRETKDLLNTVTIPVGMQFGSVLTKNIGSLKNYGLEFSINAKPIVTKDFTWDLSYNIAWNHNEITDLVGGDDNFYQIVQSTNISRGNSTRIQANKVGEPVNSFFVYQQVYDENGKPIEGMYVDRDGNGRIDDGDRYFYKKPSADVIMGLTTKFLYKNWDLSMSFRASLGNYVYYDFLSNRAVVSQSGLYTNSTLHNTTPEAVALGFTGVGAGNDNYLSDYFVRNASFLKCSNITLGYSFPALFKVGGHETCSGRAFVTAQNPFIISKYKGIDPEVSNGIDSNPYPRPFSIQIGLNLNF